MKYLLKVTNYFIDRFAFGQNIISTVHKYDQPPDFNYMINFWFSQVEYFDKSKVDKFDRYV